MPVSGQNSQSYLLPADAGYFDMVKNYAADTSGKTDVTAKIQQAIDADAGRWSGIYFPAGTYLVSNTMGGDTIKEYRFMTFWGAGSGKTVIKLKDNCPGFSDTANPKPVFYLYYSVNATHSVCYRNLTVDVGVGNPGAVGIQFISHNGGGLENVIVRAGQNSGKVGLELAVAHPGPALLKDVTVTGFDIGIDLGDALYAMTLVNITLQNQRSVGLRNQGLPLTIENLTSNNSVPAVDGYGGFELGHTIIVGANLLNGSDTNCAIQTRGSLYLRDIHTTGYKLALREIRPGDIVWTLRANLGSDITEYIGAYDALRMRYPSPARGLHLPIRPSPSVAWDNNFGDWANVNSYAAVELAFASGKPVVYFPSGYRMQYTDLQPIHVPATVKRIEGLMSSFSQQLVFENPDAASVTVVDQLKGFSVVQAGKGAVVVSRCNVAGVTTQAGSGDLFLDDYCCGKITINHSSVWARQLNVEVTPSPMIDNNGGRLWVLGYKTEQPSTVLRNAGGAMAEVIGGYVYPLSNATDPMYVNDNSALFVWHNVAPFPGQYYATFIGESRAGYATVDTTLGFRFGFRPEYICNPDSVNLSGGRAGARGAMRGVNVRAAAGLPFVIDVSDPGPNAVEVVTTTGRTVMRGESGRPRTYRVARGAAGVYFVKVRSGAGVSVTPVIAGR